MTFNAFAALVMVASVIVGANCLQCSSYHCPCSPPRCSHYSPGPPGGKLGTCQVHPGTAIVGGDLHASVPPYGKLQFTVKQDIECMKICLTNRSCYAYAYDESPAIVRRFGGCQCQLKGKHGWRAVPYGGNVWSGKCTRN